MTLKELFKMKEQMLANLANLNEADFPSKEAYQHHYDGAMEGIMSLYALITMTIVDSDEKKSA